MTARAAPRGPARMPGTPIGKAVSVTGQYYRQLERAFPSGANWLVCGWLATSESDTKPLAVGSTTIGVAGGKALVVQRAVRIGRSVIVRMRRLGVQSGEHLILRLKAPGWRGKVRQFRGSSLALTVHMQLPARPLRRRDRDGPPRPLRRLDHHANARDPPAPPRLTRRSRCDGRPAGRSR